MREALFVAYRFLDSDGQPTGGGAEIHLRAVIEVVRRYGYRIRVVQNWPTTTTILDNEDIVVLGVRSLTSTPLLNVRWRGALTDDTEIIHFNDISLAFPFADERTTATFHGGGWDVPLRGAPPQWLPSSPFRFRVNRWLWRNWSWFTARYAVSHCRGVLSVDSTLRTLAQYLDPDRRDKIDVIPNFVDSERFHPGTEPSQREALGFAPDDIVVFYPRNISFQRGYHILSELIRQLGRSHDRIRFLITGRGIYQGTFSEEGRPSVYEERLLTSIHEAGMAARVRFTGSVSHEAMPPLYRAADIVIIPTYFSEGTSFSALEAMASGKPLIASNIGGLNDLIIDGHSGFLVRPHADDFVDRIGHLVEHPEHAAAMAERAREIVSGGYHKRLWEEHIARFFQLEA